VELRVCDTEKELCDGQTCQCRQGYQSCDGGESCIDVLVNHDHCGVCNNPCDENADCINGQCICKDGFSRCKKECSLDNECIESNWTEHCGAKGTGNEPDELSKNWMGVKCENNEQCILQDSSFKCVCTDDYIMFEDTGCTDPSTNIIHCGARDGSTGVDCTLKSYKTNCVKGYCVCSDPEYTFAAIYEDSGRKKYTIKDDKIRELYLQGLGDVELTCVNTDTNSSCCGTGCIQCDNNKVCDQGICTTKCPDNYLNCNGSCMDQDKYNISSDGETSCRCNTDYCPIDGNPNNGCSGLLGDNDNCGFCGDKCPEKTRCSRTSNTCICDSTSYDQCSFEPNTYLKNSDTVLKCIDKSSDYLQNTLHIIREENCTNFGEQG
jgi:hypothetical protein